MTSTQLSLEHGSRAACGPSATLTAEEQVRAILSAAPSEPLPETVEAMQRLPEALQPLVQSVATELYFEQFRALAAQVISERAGLDASASARVDPARTPLVLAQSAKLHVLSAVGHLAGHPWHIADAKTLKSIAADIERSGEFGCAARGLLALNPVNLFVAARPQDDRDSYLAAVAAEVKRRRVWNVVLDAELIEWRPEADFRKACDAIGLRPRFVGIAERGHAAGHSMLALNGRPGVHTLLMDTAGRELRADNGGTGDCPATEAAEQTNEPAAPIRAAPESVHAKIAALRDQQRRRVARP